MCLKPMLWFLFKCSGGGPPKPLRTSRIQLLGCGILIIQRTFAVICSYFQETNIMEFDGRSQAVEVQAWFGGRGLG